MNDVLTRRPTLLFGSLIAVYAAVMAIFLTMRTAPFIGSETDGVFYMIAARSLFTKSFVPSTYGGGIGMPLAIAAVNALVSDTFRSAQLVSAIAGLVYLVASVYVCSKLFSRFVGISTGVLLLVSPILLANSSSSLTDVLAASLPLAGLCLLLSAKDSPKLFRWIAVGLVFGCAYMVRSVNFVFLPLPIVIAAGDNFRGNAKRVLFAAVGMLAGALPQLYVSQKYFGNALYSDNWRNIAAMALDWNRVNHLSSFRQAIELAGPQMIAVWIKQFFYDLPVALFHAAYLPALFFLPGVALAFRSIDTRYRRVFIVWALCIVGYLVLIAGVWRIEARYFLPVLPFVFSTGVLIWQNVASRSKRVVIAGLALAVVMSAAVAVRDGRQLLASQGTEFKEAGLYLQQHANDAGLILASQPSVFFYAQKQGLLIETIPHDDIRQLEASIASQNIRWIAFDERRGERDDPELSWLLDPQSDFATNHGWKAVFVRESPRIVIWCTHD